MFAVEDFEKPVKSEIHRWEYNFEVCLTTHSCGRLHIIERINEDTYMYYDICTESEEEISKDSQKTQPRTLAQCM